MLAWKPVYRQFGCGCGTCLMDMPHLYAKLQQLWSAQLKVVCADICNSQAGLVVTSDESFELFQCHFRPFP
jgi:hypothetical protein